jgi:adenylate cyclase
MAEERAQRRLAAILAADVAGYSRLMEADEGGTLAALKSRRRDVLEPQVARHEGRIVKLMGDGVLVEFASAVNAAQCAVELQRGFAEANASSTDDKAILLRIGVNLGDVVVEGGDLFGDGVIIAVRLQTLADPGGICISAGVYDQIEKKLALSYEDLGSREVKNMAKPVHVFRIAGKQPASGPAAAAAGAFRPAIAILPFTNMSGDPEQQYFSDGITEDIITELSRYHSLLVMARNSCFQFRGPSVDIAAVRRALGVRYIVEGSVRKAANRVRVTVQLIDASTQSHLWAERYDRDIQDIFAVQDEVTRTVVTTLEGRVAASGAEHARRKPPKEWAAYDYFLQGREHVNRYQDAEAGPFLARAIELDPGYVHAHAWRAMALANTYVHNEQQETLDAAWAGAQKALALDETDALSHQAMGLVALRARQLDLAGVHFDRAIALNPNDVIIVCDRGNWLGYVGRFEEALICLDVAQRRDPYPLNWVWETRGQCLFCLKRFDDAMEAFRKVRPQYFWIPGLLAASHAHKGQMDDARRELANYRAAKPGITLSYVAQRHMPQELRNLLLDGLRKAGLPE